MNDINRTIITVQSLIEAPVHKVWKSWTKPEHIINWNSASEDWHSPSAENDLRVGGKFKVRMEAKDGSMGFDFAGVYDEVKENEFIKYLLADGRVVTVEFIVMGGNTKVVESFDAETENPIELQKDGWQAILDNFKKYTESI